MSSPPDGGDDSLLACSFLMEGAAEKTRTVFAVGGSVGSLSLLCVADEPGGVQSGHYVWPAAPFLARFLGSAMGGAPRFLSRRVIELGAGCGLAGLAAASCSLRGGYPRAARVALSDHDPGVVATLAENVQAQPPDVAARCSAHAIAWGEAAGGGGGGGGGGDGDDGEHGGGAAAVEELLAAVGGQWEAVGGGGQCSDGVLVMAADCVYSPDVVRPLFWTAARLLSRGGYDAAGGSHATPLFLLCSSFDVGEASEAAMAAACAELGLVEGEELTAAALATDAGGAGLTPVEAATLRLRQFSLAGPAGGGGGGGARATAAAATAPLAPGTEVMCRYGGGPRWFPATVVAAAAAAAAAASSSLSYSIEFRDGDHEDGVPRHRVRLPGDVEPPALAVGAAVDARYDARGGGKQLFAATVTAAHAAADGVGGFDLRYADGDAEQRVERRHIFATCAPPPPDDLEARMRNLLRRMMKLDSWLVTADTRLVLAEEEVAALAAGQAPDRTPTKWKRPDWLPASKGKRRESVTAPPAVGMNWGDD